MLFGREASSRIEELERENADLKRQLRELNRESMDLISEIGVRIIGDDDYTVDFEIELAAFEKKHKDKKAIMRVGDTYYNLMDYYKEQFDLKASMEDQKKSYQYEDYYASLLGIALYMVYKKNPDLIRNAWHKIGYQYNLSDAQSQALFRECLRTAYSPDNMMGYGSKRSINNNVKNIHTKNKKAELFYYDALTAEGNGSLNEFQDELRDYISLSDDYKNLETKKGKELHEKFAILEKMFESLTCDS